jgi:16S rRNA (guanine527-N7)-methyltransferase
VTALEPPPDPPEQPVPPEALKPPQVTELAAMAPAAPMPPGLPRPPEASGPPGPPRPPEEARALFGAAIDRAAAYAELLAVEGTLRGLIGPREVPRLWERHLLNCAVVAELLPAGARIVDVGSGAGLPGIVLALVRPDVTVTLLEPLARRAAFLAECRERLDLGNATVRRGRGEEPAVMVELAGADVVTARAVAPLDRLLGWCLPLLRPGGQLLALKGDAAETELAAAAPALARFGGAAARVVRCGASVVSPPTTVVTVTRGTVRTKARGGRGR